METWIKEKLITIARQNRAIITVVAVVLLGVITWRTCAPGQGDPIIDVPLDSVAVVVHNLTPPLVLPAAGDTSVNMGRKIASMKNDSAKIAQDSRRDKNMEKPCDELLAAYKKVVDELVASDFSEEAYTKYTTFGMIKDDNGLLRLGPKLAACKEDPAFKQAFDEIDKRLITTNH